jgi:hypothetical protein
MHTHTTSSPAKVVRHRWLVASPFLVLMLLLSMREGFIGSSSLHAQITETGSVLTGAHADPRVLSIGHTHYRLEAGSDLALADVPLLRSGTVLVSSDALSRVAVDDLQVEGWNGGFQITKTDGDVIIATLSTPVFVTQGSHSTLIPAFMQWKEQQLTSLQAGVDHWYLARAVRLLPESFSRDRLQILSELSDSGSSISDASVVPAFISPLFGQELRFQSAQDRAESTVRLERIAALRSALQGDTSTLDPLLLAPDIQELLLSTEGQAALPALLSLAVQVNKGDAFLPFFTTAPDRLLLASFHPLIQGHARILPITATLTDDERAAFLLFTPVSDALPEGLPDLAVSQWQSVWKNVTQTQSGALLFAESLPLLQQQIHRLDVLQYPARVDAYSSALLSIAAPIENTFTPVTHHLLEDIRILRTERRMLSPIADVSSSSASSSSISSSSAPSAVQKTVSPDVLVADATHAFTQAGFMMTAQTSLKPVGTLVQVTNIVFGTTKGDALLQFSYDPLNDVVSAIKQNGQILPNSLSL